MEIHTDNGNTHNQIGQLFDVHTFEQCRAIWQEQCPSIAFNEFLSRYVSTRSRIAADRTANVADIDTITLAVAAQLFTELEIDICHVDVEEILKAVITLLAIPR